MLSPIADDREALIAEAVLKTLEVGASALAETYPNYIKANSVHV